MTKAPANVVCVVLAAGGSSRFGSAKQLQRYDGEILVRRAVKAANESGAAHVILVTGANAEAVEKAVDDFASLRIVRNDAWIKGLSCSIAAGIGAIDDADTIDGVLITLGDQPLVDGSCLGRLISAFDEKHRIVAASYNDIAGAPVLFGREHLDFLKQISGDKGARQLLARMTSVTRIPMREAALDIDEARDLQERD
jgi:molybdenum cofactor cytidylyltransferase